MIMGRADCVSEPCFVVEKERSNRYTREKTSQRYYFFRLHVFSVTRRTGGFSGQRASAINMRKGEKEATKIIFSLEPRACVYVSRALSRSASQKNRLFYYKLITSAKSRAKGQGRHHKQLLSQVG